MHVHVCHPAMLAAKWRSLSLVVQHLEACLEAKGCGREIDLGICFVLFFKHFLLFASAA